MLEGHLDCQRQAITAGFIGRTDLAPHDAAPRMILGRSDVSTLVSQIEDRFTSFDSFAATKRKPDCDNLGLDRAKQFDESDLISLLNMLRQLIEHKVSVFIIIIFL